MPQEPITPAETTKSSDWREPAEEELGLKRYLETIRERWILVVVSTAVCFAVAVLYVAVAQKQYSAEADMLITPVDPSTLPSLPLIRQSADPTRDVETAQARDERRRRGACQGPAPPQREPAGPAEEGQC